MAGGTQQASLGSKVSNTISDFLSGRSGGVANDLHKKVLGLPFHFSSLTDPNGRVYSKYLQTSFIVGIIPGRPQFNPGTIRKAKFDALKALMGKASDAEGDSKEGWSEKIDNPGGNRENSNGLQDGYSGDAIEKLQDAEKTLREKNPEDVKNLQSLTEMDLRFYSFKPDFHGYRKVLNLLLNEVGGKLLGFGLYNVQTYYEEFATGSHSNGVAFCAQASSTVSESFSNELADSMISGMTKGVSSQVRELAYVFGVSDEQGYSAAEKETANEKQKNFAAGISGYAQAARDSIAKTFSNSGFDAAAAITKGENILFPKIWQNSSFEKSISMSFRFLSPYGDPASIFKFVYVPFLALLAMAGPMQASTDSFKSPFILRVNCPGILESDMCMITSLSWVRGTSNNLYSAAGLPLGIDVTATFTDLYPTMSLASEHHLLRQNVGLSSFLDNMCVLLNSQLNIAANIAGSFSTKVSRAFGIIDEITDSFKDSMDNMANIFVR